MGHLQLPDPLIWLAERSSTCRHLARFDLSIGVAVESAPAEQVPMSSGANME